MKLKYLYHGSTTPSLQELTPQKRYTPKTLGKNAKPAIYAAADPAYAAGHAFPWVSDEGFDIYELNNTVTLIVPKKHRNRLNQETFIYKLPSKDFRLLKEEQDPKTRIYLTNKKVKPISVKSFKNVKEAIEFYGGKVEFIEGKKT